MQVPHVPQVPQGPQVSQAAADYTYLFFTLTNNEYTDNFSIDLTTYNPLFKQAIEMMFQPIIDVELGDFIVYKNDFSMILYKIISIGEDSSWFTVPECASHRAVFYHKDDTLFCRSPSLKRDFYSKISMKDILRILKRIKVRVDQNRGITESILVDSDTLVIRRAEEAKEAKEPVQEKSWFIKLITSCMRLESNVKANNNESDVLPK